jgi:hypothetical protein
MIGDEFGIHIISILFYFIFIRLQVRCDNGYAFRLYNMQ